MDVTAYMNDLRRRQGLLTLDEVVELGVRNLIYDPHSLLISSGVRIGAGNIFFPNVSLFRSPNGSIEIGDLNVFHSITTLDAASGPIRIGSGNQFGEGGFTARCNRSGAAVDIGDEGRYQNGAAVFGLSHLGSGSQLLGAISVDSCRLEAGGSFRTPDPDERAGLLKGFGAVRNLTVPRGCVIVGAGTFDAARTERQAAYHPKA